MTQLPEAEVARKGLASEVVGKRVESTEVMTASLVTRQRNRPELYKALQGRKVSGASRRGTALMLELEDDTTLVIVMGSRAWITHESSDATPERSVQMVLRFASTGALHYHDQDKDGALLVVPDDAIPDLPELTPGGIDPLADVFTWQAFSSKLVELGLPLRAALVDSRVLLGLGDVYADEILWNAGISGARDATQLSAQEVRRLYRAVLEVINEAVKQGGASTSETQERTEDDDPEDVPSSFLHVHGRKGEPCSRCRNPVELADVSGHLSFHCPQCQT